MGDSTAAMKKFDEMGLGRPRSSNNRMLPQVSTLGLFVAKYKSDGLFSF